MIFSDRYEAGRKLAEKLLHYTGRTDVLVLGLPRGGVPVAFEVARQLLAPLDVFVVRKLGLPGHEELAMGAIASGDVVVLNSMLLKQFEVPAEDLDATCRREEQELLRREELYRRGRPPYKVEAKDVIVVDDGLATGASMRAAVLAIKKHSPRRVIVAVPVSSQEAFQAMRSRADEIVCVHVPEPFIAVGAWYEDFSQTSDEEVQDLLDVSARRWKAA